MKRIRKAIIPAAGYGTRLLPVTKIIPKELLPIGNKPAIQYVVEEAAASGIEEIILVCHPSKTAIVDYFLPDKPLLNHLKEKGKTEEVRELKRIESLASFRVVYQDVPLGLGHAILRAKEAIGDESFAVMLPDVLVVDPQPATGLLLDECQRQGALWGMLLEKVSPHRLSSYGIVRGEPQGNAGYKVIGAVEKPLPYNAPSNFGILGRYLFTPEIFGFLEKLQCGALGEFQLTDAIDQMARVSPGHGVVCSGDILDVGTPQGLVKAYQYFEDIHTMTFNRVPKIIG